MYNNSSNNHAFRINNLLNLPPATFDDIFSRARAEGRVRAVGITTEWVVTPVDRDEMFKVERVVPNPSRLPDIFRRNGNWQHVKCFWLSVSQKDFITTVRGDFKIRHPQNVTKGYNFSPSDYLQLYTRV